MGPVTEAQRVHLYQTLQRELGDEDAATMMAMLPPPGSAGVATKEDLAQLATREEMRNELHQQTRLFVTWLLTANATMTAIFGLFVGMLAAFG